MSREELDLVIKSQLFAHRRTGLHTEAKKHKVKERERPYQEFYFQGKRVCRTTFCFLHNIERKKMLAISKSLDVDGLGPRVHGRVGKAPAHSLTFSDRERVKTFLCQYARDNALPLPGRLPNYRDSKVLLLPSDSCKEDIFKSYAGMADEMHYRTISLRSFLRIWQELCPHIVITEPCTDLCQTCQNFANKISNSGNLTEEEKSTILSEYDAHVKLAKEQRDHYRQQCSDSKATYSSLDDTFKQSGNHYYTCISLHYTYDFTYIMYIFVKFPVKY